MGYVWLGMQCWQAHAFWELCYVVCAWEMEVVGSKLTWRRRVLFPTNQTEPFHLLRPIVYVSLFYMPLWFHRVCGLGMSDGLISVQDLFSHNQFVALIEYDCYCDFLRSYVLSLEFWF